MSFEYVWHRQEANFGPPINGEVSGGTHISIENIPTYKGKFVALRRPEAVPNHEVPIKAQSADTPHLYFVHDLPVWGETLDDYVPRIVREQAGVGVVSYRVAHLKMAVYEDSRQWAWTPYTFVELDELPVPGCYGNDVTEVLVFDIDSIPPDLGWWTVDELREFLERFA